MVFGPSSIGRLLRRLHGIRAGDPVPEDLRGWSWWRPPLRPRASFGLGVSEVAYRYCPTRRDVWLRRVAGLEAPRPSNGMARGRVVHNAFRASARDAAKLFYEGLSTPDIVAEMVSRAGEKASVFASGLEGAGDGLLELGARAYKKFAFYWASWIEETGQPPWYTEYVVDGSVLGLSSRLRVDALGIGLVVEVKVGQWRSDYPVGLAGYALALEASHEIPVDYGLVVLVSGDASKLSLEPVYIGAEERREFIRARDEVIEMLLSGIDPGMPSTCPQSCPFRAACRGGGGPAGVEAWRASSSSRATVSA